MRAKSQRRFPTPWWHNLAAVTQKLTNPWSSNFQSLRPTSSGPQRNAGANSEIHGTNLARSTNNLQNLIRPQSKSTCKYKFFKMRRSSPLTGSALGNFHLSQYESPQAWISNIQMTSWLHDSTRSHHCMKSLAIVKIVSLVMPGKAEVNLGVYIFFYHLKCFYKICLPNRTL